MNTITIPKIEYKKLKEHSSAYLKIVQYITDVEREFTYDYKHITGLVKEARDAHKKGKTIEAGSVDEALKKLRKK
jgi:hypothetical protein